MIEAGQSLFDCPAFCLHFLIIQPEKVLNRRNLWYTQNDRMKMQEMILAEKIKRGILVFSVAPSDLCHAEVAAVLMYYIRENMTEKLKQHS